MVYGALSSVLEASINALDRLHPDCNRPDYYRSIHLVQTMNLKEAQQRIIQDELPSSEAALLLNEVSTCPNMDCLGGCSIVEVCHNDPVEHFYEELKTTPF